MHKDDLLDAPRVLSFGGGVNSVALLLRFIEDGNHPDLVVFADPGDEDPATHAVVVHSEGLCRREGIPSERVAEGDLVEESTEAGIIPLPHRGFRSCTEKYKVRPIRRLLRAKGWDRARMLLGIAKDEAHRMKDSNVDWIVNEWPLIYDYGMTRAACHQVIAEMWDGPPVPKSGCRGCPFIGTKGYLKLAREAPEAFDRWQRLEENARGFPKNRIFADGPTLAQIKERAKTEKSILSDWSRIDEEAAAQECGGGCMT